MIITVALNSKLSGDIIVVKLARAMENKIPLDILHDDEDLVVINKSPGVVMHPGAGNYNNTLVKLRRCINEILKREIHTNYFTIFINYIINSFND